MRYTVCLDERKGAGLLFQSLDTSKIAEIKELATLFPGGYFIRTAGDKNPSRYYNGGWRTVSPEKDPPQHVLVSCYLRDVEPDKATLEDADIRFYYNGAPHMLNLRARFNACLSMFKAVGCSSCPDKGMSCLSEGAGFEVPDLLYKSPDEEELYAKLQKEFSLLGGFHLVAPTSTRIKDFVAKFRPYWQHNFEDIERNDVELSERAYKGAETKKFKREQCSKCVISNSCDRASHCKGAYPPEVDIIKQCDAELGAILKNSTWPEWQLWEIARGMGEEAKHSRWNIVLTGLELRGNDGLHATVHRSKGNIVEYGNLKTYEEIAKVFGLALTEKDVKINKGPLTDPGLRATLWLALNSHRAHQSYGWGCRRYVTGVGVGADCVRVMWTNGGYINYHNSELVKISDVAAKMTDGYLGDIRKVEVR